MSQGKMFGGLIAGAMVFATLAIVASFVLNQADESKTEIEVYGTVPAFSMITQDSTLFTQQDLQGKLTVVDFFFTTCPGICPTMAVEKQRLYDAFDDTDLVQIVSVSVHPEVDVPPVLKQYAHDHGVTDLRWQFLHAPEPEVVELCEQGFLLPAENLPMGHSSKFALVDGHGRIRGYYNSLEQKPMIALREQITTLLSMGEDAGLPASM